ncbi:hypothetical protein BP6252_13906 [Coleophoma cylindrospora]|uniref:Carboxylic ester hydrolase n=1 Tax=Coleophoma cylindrospora TaxID=1849047 RepID=A0A3D8Q6K1_9HELO|nr:hypothetical protein BP6252_13906 [Coleophoma cylindrospora]
MRKASTFLAILTFIAWEGLSNATTPPSTGTTQARALPTVDLGYAIHKATINVTGAYFNFSNIRFADPPLGELRFAAPIPPSGRNTTVNDGQQVALCPQGGALHSPLENEDCLFLDVIVPKSIYYRPVAMAARGEEIMSSVKSTGAPVLVWIYGGGFSMGSKTYWGAPPGLIEQSQASGAEGVVYVAFNYRLGLFGFLSGPTFQQEGTPNAGLYDQRLALDWIQKNIRLFGGDASRVTVMGESAGGASIMHQITAYGGQRGTAFQQAIVQSPGFSPLTSDVQKENFFQSVLASASTLSAIPITSVSELRNLATAELQAVNSIVLATITGPGIYPFGPAVDGDLVPALPGVLLLEGKFDQSIKVMVGHNEDEGRIFTSPTITTDVALASFLRSQLPAAQPAVLAYIQDVLYPPLYNGSLPYTTEFGRADLITSEFLVTCNTRFLDLAYNNETFAYFYTIPAGLHAEDLAYTFFNGDTSTSDEGGPPVNASIAVQFQKFLTNFAMTGDPNGRGVMHFPVYGPTARVLDIDIGDLGHSEMDSVVNNRCLWWQQAFYA